MARPRQFDERRALHAAAEVFWTHGYEATSTERLCDAVNMGRSSIYNAFTSKRNLYLRALGCYLDEREELLDETLDADDIPAHQRLRELFRLTIRDTARDRRGCMATNGITELAGYDDVAVEMINAHNARRHTRFVVFITAAQARREIDPGKDPAELATFIIATFSGLAVMARSGTDTTTLHGIVDTALSAL